MMLFRKYAQVRMSSGIRFCSRASMVMGLVFLFSCESSTLISDDVLSGEKFNITLLKDLALDFSTIRLDSLATSRTGTVTVGSNQQSGIGVTTHNTCFQPGLDLSTYSTLRSSTDFESITFDSLVIVMISNGKNYFESDDFVTLYIDQYLTPLELLDNGYLYNTSLPPAGKIQVGSRRFRSGLEDGDELEIGLKDSLGKELFQRMVDDDEVYSTNQDFVEFIGGFEVYTNLSSQILSFYADSLKMRMYYTNKNNIPPTREYLDFPINDGIYYTYTHNELDSQFEGLESFDDNLSSDSTERHTYLAGGSLLGTVVDFPGVEILALEEQDYILAHAELRLYPLSESASDYDKLPETLVAYFIDEDNSTITSQDEFITATLTFDETYKRDTYYTIEVSALIEFFLTPFTQYNYSLLVMLPYDEVTNNPKSLMIEDGSMRSELILYTLEN